ncbi:MAG: hypothetical protein M5U34_39885 [Chloroflexi bacterium]|nr:hypothetical protein [Chloroflexota bacterium]
MVCSWRVTAVTASFISAQEMGCGQVMLTTSLVCQFRAASNHSCTTGHNQNSKTAVAAQFKQQQQATAHCPPVTVHPFSRSI